jgi:uncharacterized protein YndB with AHSA1/START domain
MKALKIGAIALGGFILLLVIVGLFLPREFEVSRSIVIDAPPERVFVHVNDVRKQEAWSAQKAVDPTVVYSYPPPDESVGEGAWYSWTSDHSGAGKLTIVRSDPPRRIEATVEFERGRGVAIFYTFEPVDGGTRVAWGIGAEAGWNIPHRYMGLFAENLIGPWLKEELDLLKALVESEPAAETPTPPPPAP